MYVVKDGDSSLMLHFVPQFVLEAIFGKPMCQILRR